MLGWSSASSAPAVRGAASAVDPGAAPRGAAIASPAGWEPAAAPEGSLAALARDVLAQNATTDPVAGLATDLRDALGRADERESIDPVLARTGRDLRSDMDPLGPRCTAEPGETRHEICVVGDPTATRRAAIIGSSHAMMWLPGLSAQAERDGVQLAVYVKYGCSPFTFTMRRAGRPWAECETWRDWAIGELAARPPDLVLVASHIWVDIASPDGAALRGREFDDAYAGGVGGLVARLGPILAGGGRVTVLGDTTRRDRDPGRCAALRRGGFHRCEQRITLDTVRLNDLTRWAAEAAGGAYYDPGELVCLEARCPVISGGRFVFRDRLGHVTASYSRHAGPALAARVGLGR